MTTRRRASHVLVRILFVLLLSVPTGGCGILGIAANAVPEADVPARYTGLKGHTLAVMVWADRGVQIDYPSPPLHVAAGVQATLHQALKSRRGEVHGASFPSH